MANENLKPRDTTIAQGEITPDFTLQTSERKDWHLAEAVKKGDTVLCFFPFAFTGVCGTEMRCVTQEMAGPSTGAAVPAHGIARIVMGDAIDDITRAGQRNRDEGRVINIQAVFERL